MGEGRRRTRGRLLVALTVPGIEETTNFLNKLIQLHHSHPSKFGQILAEDLALLLFSFADSRLLSVDLLSCFVLAVVVEGAFSPLLLVAVVVDEDEDEVAAAAAAAAASCRSICSCSARS